MSSPVAVIGLTYASADIQQLDLTIFFRVKRGINETPSVRGVDVTVPVREGRIARSRVVDMLPILLEGQVTTNPTVTDPDDAKASYRDNWQIVRTLFDPSRDPAALVATLEDGSIWTIDARPLNIVTTLELPGWFWEGTIELDGYGDWEVVGS